MTYSPEDFGGSDEGSHYMSTKQGLGHEDPPVEGGYTGFGQPSTSVITSAKLQNVELGSRRGPRNSGPADPSSVGGLGHVHGMFCDGQDHGRNACDVQQAYYARQNEASNKLAHEYHGHSIPNSPFRDAFTGAWKNKNICCLQPGVISSEETEMANPDAVPTTFSDGKGTKYVRKHTPHNLTPAGLARHQLVHLETLFGSIEAGISGKLALKLVEAYRELCHLYNERCHDILNLESQLKEIEERAKPR